MIDSNISSELYHYINLTADMYAFIVSQRVLCVHFRLLDLKSQLKFVFKNSARTAQ
jgi:hypothetical protein